MASAAFSALTRSTLYTLSLLLVKPTAFNTVLWRVLLGQQGNIRCSLPWLGQRIAGTAVPPPVKFCESSTPQ